MKIELTNVSFSYQQLGSFSDDSELALDNIDLTIKDREVIGFVGASGSGKTTLIQILNGLLAPDEGEVLLDGCSVSYKGEFAYHWHKRVGIVFQFPEFQFFENTIYDEISYALFNQNIPRAEIHERIKHVLEVLELWDEDFIRRSPFNISEGQKRRVALASILVLEPEILILDEPTAGLDYSGIQILKRILVKICESNRTVIIVSHDMDFVAELCQRIIALSHGKIIYDGPKQDFFIQSDLLEEAHLQMPQVLQVARKLRQQNVPVNYPVFSMDELQETLRKIEVA